MVETLTGELRARESHRSYPTVQGPAEPVELFGRLAREGIRLRRSGLFLIAEVPDGTTRARSWPALDRLLARHAASLAATATLAGRFAARWSPERISALLAELRAEVPEILRETVGGEERLEALIARPRSDADAALACVACCRGLAIRALCVGRSLAGLLAGRDCDGRGRGRRRHRAARTGDGRPRASGSAEAAGVADDPGELPDVDRSLSKRWSCTYEFASPDTALLYVACVAALAAATGVWPLVELRARRVSLRLPAGDASTTRQSAVPSDLLGWARRMGGRTVDCSDETWGEG